MGRSPEGGTGETGYKVHPPMNPPVEHNNRIGSRLKST